MTIGNMNQPPLAPGYTLPETPTAPPSPPLGNALGTNFSGIPGLPTDVEKYYKGNVTSKDVENKQGLLRQDQFNLLNQQMGLEQQIGENKQQQEQYLAQAKADIARQNRESAQRIEQSIQDTRKQFPYPEFHPTKDNVQDLATLFSLIGVIGVAMGGQGKMGATASLNAMSGMMQGWQKGRQDLWVKEKDEFDKNMARVKQVLDDAYKDADRAMKTLAYNREEAEAYANQAAAKMGSQVGKQILQKQGVEKFYNYMEGIKGDLQKTESMLQQKELHAQTEAAAERRHREQMQQAKDLAEIRAQGKGRVGDVQFRYNAVVANNIEQVKNGINQITAFDPHIMPPMMAEAITNPAGGIPTALESELARTLTERDARLFQQAGAGLKRAITNIEASGISRGASDKAMAEYGKMEPRSDDSVLSKLYYLAEVRQIAELGYHDLQRSGGTPEQLSMAKENLDFINSQVKFTTNDVIGLAKRMKNVPEKDISRMAEQSQGFSNFVGTLGLARETAQYHDDRQASQAPTLKEFLDKARPLNPTLTDEQITQEYRRRYGG